MKEKLKKILSIWKIGLYMLSDTQLLLRHSLSSITKSLDNDKARLLLVIHSIEKGLSFAIKKEGWGGQKALSLCNLLKAYIKRNGVDLVAVNGINVLHSYLMDAYSSKEERLVSIISDFIAVHRKFVKNGFGGLKIVSRPAFENSFEELLHFFGTRHSIRAFSSQCITEEEFSNAKRIANTTPTACNRQSIKIYSFKNKEIMKLILDNQLGDQGWCLHANSLYVVTSSLSYFNGTYERHQALVDGGLYAMNFVWGLHAQKIGTCFKMYVRDPNRDKEFKAICSIPQNEVPVVLILAGHYIEKEITVPFSYRFDKC